MKIGKLFIDIPKGRGYKLYLDWPGVISIARHDSTILPCSYGCSDLTIVLGGGVNGRGRVLRFENYKNYGKKQHEV